MFNAKMMEDPKKPKTMWRITSNGDFGASDSNYSLNWSHMSVIEFGTVL